MQWDAEKPGRAALGAKTQEGKEEPQSAAPAPPHHTAWHAEDLLYTLVPQIKIKM